MTSKCTLSERNTIVCAVPSSFVRKEHCGTSYSFIFEQSERDTWISAMEKSTCRLRFVLRGINLSAETKIIATIVDQSFTKPAGRLKFYLISDVTFVE